MLVSLTNWLAPYLRADQVSIEEYRSKPTKYTFPITPATPPEVGKHEIFKVNVTEPEGEIKVKVYWPTDDAAQKGSLRSDKGLPAHVNYHGGMEYGLVHLFDSLTLS